MLTEKIQMKKTVSKKISLYNFIMTICIVFYHSKNACYLLNLSEGGKDSLLLKYSYNFMAGVLGALALGVFFAMSGFLLYYNANNSYDMLGKMKKRVYSLVIPFFVWNTLMLLYEVAYQIIKYKTIDITFMRILLGYSFDTFVGAFWYILALMILMLISPLIIKLKKHLIVSSVLMVGLICFSCFRNEIFGFLQESLIKDWFMRFFNYLPIYFLGAFGAMFFGRNLATEKYNAKLYGIISLIISLIIIACVVFLEGLPVKIKWILLFILPVSTWFIVDSNIIKFEIKFPLKISFFIFATHQLLIGIYNSTALKILNRFTYPPILAIVMHFVMVGIIYFVVLCFAFIAKKILPKKIYAVLSGGRTE